VPLVSQGLVTNFNGATKLESLQTGNFLRITSLTGSLKCTIDLDTDQISVYLPQPF
jgi:hypothetical protein